MRRQEKAERQKKKEATILKKGAEKVCCFSSDVQLAAPSKVIDGERSEYLKFSLRPTVVLIPPSVSETDLQQ